MPAVHQCLDDRLVGVAFLTFVIDDALTDKPRRRLRKSAILVDGVGNSRIDPAILQFDFVRDPYLEVVPAVSWRGVHKSGPVLVGDMVAGQQGHEEVITARTLQWMVTSHAAKHASIDGSHFFKSRDARLLENGLGQLVGENKEIVIFHPVVGRRVNDP